MSFTKLTSNLAVIAALADLPNATDGLSPAQLKAKFDEASGLIKTYLNSTLTTELESTTVGASGAHSVGSAPITGVTGTNVYAQMASIFSQLQAAVIGQIPDGSITPVKLSFDPATQVELLNTIRCTSMGGMS